MKSSRRSYTVEQKLDVLKTIEEKGLSLHVAARQFNIGRKQIRDWKRKHEDLQQFHVGGDGKRRKIHFGRPPLSSEIDHEVYKFLNEELIKGRVVTNTMLQTYAAERARQLNLDFKASGGWLKRWKTRFHVGIRKGTNDSKDHLTVFTEEANNVDHLTTVREDVNDLDHRTALRADVNNLDYLTAVGEDVNNEDPQTAVREDVDDVNHWTAVSEDVNDVDHQTAVREDVNDVDHRTAVREDVNDLRRQHDYTTHNISYVSETVVRFESCPSSTNNVQGIASTWAKKKGFTVTLSARGNGEKNPALMIFKGENGRFGPQVLQNITVPYNVTVQATENGWMTGAVMVGWYHDTWGQNVNNVRRLLVLDRARQHMTQAVRDRASELETDVVFIPQGCTSIMQPMDVFVNKPFKDSLRRQWISYMHKGQKTEKGNLKHPTLQHLINWVSRAWADISSDVVKKSLLSTGIVSALDGAKDDMLSEKIPVFKDDSSTETIRLMFDDEGDNDDIDFEGFYFDKHGN